MLDGDISMGAGVTLRSLPRLLSQFGIPGLDVEGLRVWCEVLGVPCVEISGTPFINVFEFQIAITAATSIGSPSFSLDEPPKKPAQTPSTEKLTSTIVKLVSYREAMGQEGHKQLVAAARSVAHRIQAAVPTEVMKRSEKQPWVLEGRERLKKHRTTIDFVEKELLQQ